jgi:hypothetical protein
MKGMQSAQGLKACPPAGTYAMTIVAADPGFTATKVVANQQRGGDSKISLALEIVEGEHVGFQAFDELGTDGNTKFGAMSKKRLRQLDVQGLDTDAEIPDDAIAASLLNRRVFAVCEREQREDKDGNKQFDVDEKSGLKVPSYRLRVIGYTRQPTAGQQLAPQQQHAPMQAPQAPQGYAPPPGYIAPQQFAAPPAPGAWPQQAPQGYAPPAPGAVPGGYAPPAPPQGFPQVAPPQGWANGAGAPGAPGAPGVAPGQPGLPFPGAPR